MCLHAVPVLSDVPPSGVEFEAASTPVPVGCLESRGARSSSLNRVLRARRSRGAVLLEYALVLSAVVVPTMLGASLAGVKMLSDYRIQRDHVMRSTP